MKKCKKCEEEKILDHFYKHKSYKDNVDNTCKICRSKIKKEYRASKKGKAATKDYRERTKTERNKYYKEYNKTEKRKEYLRQHNKESKLKLYYNLTLKEYNGILSFQNNKCKICEIDLIKPHVDHCHSTGKIRGILCRACNHGLGNFKDNKALLLKAMEYLE